MRLTRQILLKGKNANNSWSNKQIEVFGVSIKNNKGWYNQIIDTEVTEEQVRLFLKLSIQQK